jgi:hypothetical protein
MSTSPASGRLKGFAKGAGAVLVTLVTITGGIQYIKQPSVRSRGDGPLAITYMAQDGVLEFGFDLTFDNTGYGSEVLGSANATLVNRALPPDENSVPFGNNVILFSDNAGGKPSPAPITIDKESARKLRCTIVWSPGNLSRKVIETTGRLELSINLFGKKKYLNRFGDEQEYTHKFCFDSDGGALKRLGREPQMFFSVACP